jgi:hypothetical protein
MKYQCGCGTFNTLTEAIAYANFIHNITGIILGIEEIK